MAELEQVTQKAVASGIREGLRSVIKDDEYMEAFWNQGVKMAKQQATLKAGTLLVDGLWGLFKKAGTFLLLGLILYSVGGWDLAARFIKFFFTDAK